MIGKDYFLRVYHSYPYNGFTKFILRYFCDTKLEDRWLKRILVFFFIVAYVVAGASIIGSWDTNLVAYIVIPYTILIVLLGLFILIASAMKKWNTGKIRGTLHVSMEEYNRCMKKYLNRNW